MQLLVETFFAGKPMADDTTSTQNSYIDYG